MSPKFTNCIIVTYSHHVTSILSVLARTRRITKAQAARFLTLESAIGLNNYVKAHRDFVTKVHIGTKCKMSSKRKI